jgi:hypothetical protein
MAKTVRVLLHSGLGNQMFMYAAGRALALRSGAQLVLELRRFVFEQVYHRIFLLDRFPIAATIDDGESWARRLGQVAETCVVRHPILRRLWGLRLERNPDVYEPDLVDRPATCSAVLQGYWQSERYFADHAATIRRELTPPQPTTPDILADLARVKASPHPVAVCIRTFREVPGRIVDLPGILGVYRRVLARHSAEHAHATYFVATDSPEALGDPHCLGVPFTIIGRSIGNEAAPENLYVLTQCRDYVLGYSTFHWWGAWLSVALQPRVTYLRFPSDAREAFVPPGWSVVNSSD